MTDLPSKIMREVLSVRDARGILIRLAAASAPVQYSRLRRELDLHAESFKRLLTRLEHHGMVGRRLRGKPNNLGHREVFLEITSIGHFWADRWKAWERETEAEAEARHIPLKAS